MERNWDPGVVKFFVKILNSIALGLLWMMASFIAGIYFELGYTNGKPLIYTILFYAGMLAGLFSLSAIYTEPGKTTKGISFLVTAQQK